MSYSMFSIEEDNILTSLIQENRILYDTNHEFYKDVAAKEKIWSEIAMTMNKSADECRKRWKYIRDSYNRYKRQIKYAPDGKSKSKTSKWEFFKKLSLFLEQIPDNNESRIMGIEYAAYPGESSQLFEGSDNEMMESEPTQSPKSKPSPIPKSRNAYIHMLKRKKEAKQKLAQQMKHKDSDDNCSFSNYVKAVLKVLPARLKLQAKNEIFNILAKYEMQHLDLQERNIVPVSMSSNPSSPASNVSYQQELIVKEEPFSSDNETCN